jgi:hypothetical protein
MNSRQAARSTTPTKSDCSIEATESAVARAVLPTVLVLMGVSGSGKSNVALELHRVLGWPFQEGDDRVCRSGQTDGGVDIDLPHGGTEGSNPAVSLLRTAPAIRKVQFARKLEMLEAALSSRREGEGGCRQSDPGSPYVSYPFINFSQ